jgi:hypothetical protein
MPQLRIAGFLLAAALSAAGCADLRDSIGPEAPAVLAGNTAGPPSRLQEGQYSFNTLSDEHLWIYVANSDSVAVIGLTRPGLARGVWRGRVLLDRGRWREAERAVTRHPGVELVSSDSLLPRVTVRIRDAAALAGVRRLPFIDYMEPVSVPAPKEGAFASGCSQTDFSNRDNIVDGEVIAGSLRDIGVVSAWRRSSGAGTTIGLVDSGISGGQDELDVYFNDGQSSGRTLRLLDVIPGDWQDCKHGVKMAGLMVAPRRGVEGELRRRAGGRPRVPGERRRRRQRHSRGGEQHGGRAQDRGHGLPVHQLALAGERRDRLLALQLRCPLHRRGGNQPARPAGVCLRTAVAVV